MDAAVPGLDTTLDQVAALVPGPRLAIDALAIAGDLSDQQDLSSAFQVEKATLAAAALANLSAGCTIVNRDRLHAMLATHVEIDGHQPDTWAPLSGYYSTADNETIQLHCNFAHHASGVVDLLGCEPTRAGVEQAVAQHNAADLEQRLMTAGLIGARLRTMNEWDDHPHAQATASLPLIEVTKIGEGTPRASGRRHRVLDCSRVLAGPVTSMVLAADGSDVLRVGAKHLPSVQGCVIATGFSKRNTFVDLNTPDGRSSFGSLLADADVWVDSYRPGSFADRGFGLDQVPPGSVVIQISAFDWVGPWAQRRGYDSIVQSTTGMVKAGSEWSGSQHPVPLPVQALDYCTGLIGAFAARQLVRHQSVEGGTWLARLSLLRTRNWLVGLGSPRSFEPRSVNVLDSGLHTVDSVFGRVRAAAPIGGGRSNPPQGLGSSPPAWQNKTQSNSH